MKLSTEEDVKIKIVLDYLKSLGFKEDELSFEDSFLLYLGRSTYKIDTLEQRTKAQPRLDILVRRNNINLFVVEVKSDLITFFRKKPIVLETIIFRFLFHHVYFFYLTE